MSMDDAAPHYPIANDDTGLTWTRGGRRNVRLALLAAAVLLPAAILATGAWATWRLTWADGMRSLTRTADVNAEHVQRAIDRLVRAGTRIAGAVEAGDTLAGGAAAQTRAAALLGGAPLLRTAFVYGADGREALRVDSRPDGLSRGPGGGILAALAAAEPGAVVVGTAYPGDDGQDVVFALGMRRAAPGGTVVLVLDSGAVGRAMARNITAGIDVALLLRADGEVLARSPPLTEPVPPVPAADALMRAIADGRERADLTGTIPRSDLPMALALQRLPDLPDLVAVVGRGRPAILERWHQTLLPLLAVGVPAVFALLGLAIIVRRQQSALQDALEGLEQRVVERTAALLEGEQRLRLAIEAGQFGTWETDLSTGMTTRSPQTVEILDLPPGTTLSPFSEWSERIHPADRRRVLEAWDGLGTGRLSAYHGEYRYRRRDGSWCWLESTGGAVRVEPSSGRPLRIAGTVKDITERRDAEERRTLLTQEVNHRARNTLAIVQAILRLAHAATPDDLAKLVEGRVAALARAQALLAAEHWTGAPLAALIADELAPFGKVAGSDGGEGRLRLDGPAFRIRAEAVQALGMVFHELATNAAKHGALSVPGGRVAVTWVADETAGLLRIRWTETNGPSPSFPTRRGVGSRVIEATVTGQLGGGVDRRWPEEGLICDISLPLAQLRAGPG
jgi:PAS domain S-box-containing protein